MSDNHNTSQISSETLSLKKTESHTKKRKRKRVNWHEAVSCALQIDLKDYANLLEYKSEYTIGKNSYRIDLLIIKKLVKEDIPKKIASLFKTFNLFEIKGIGSSATINSYYKTIGYAGLLINQLNQSSQQYHISALDISLALLSCHYPRKLIAHLEKDRKIEVAKYAPGVYHINKETFTVQIIVTKELGEEENLYLHCLTDKLNNTSTAKRLIEDYKHHQKQSLYNRYMYHLAATYQRTMEDGFMVDNEWIFELCGTSSDEIIERTRQEDADFYLPKIDSLSADIKALFSQVTYLKSLLEQNNIPFNPDFEFQSGQ